MGQAGSKVSECPQGQVTASGGVGVLSAGQHWQAEPDLQ